MRTIDADALLEEMDEHFLHIGRAEEVRDMINNLPTIESAPVWTPCSEGLPDRTDLFEITFVIVKTGIRYTTISKYNYKIKTWEWKFNGVEVPIPIGYRVIAWRLRSEPYQDQKAGE